MAKSTIKEHPAKTARAKKAVVENSNGEWPVDQPKTEQEVYIDDAKYWEEHEKFIEIENEKGSTAEQKAKNEVVKFNIPRAWIAQKKEEYLKLTVSGIEDKTGLTAVTKAWQEVRNKRLAVEKKHKELKGDYLVITRAIDGEKNELVDLLREIEDPLKLEIDRIEEAKEYIKQEAERKAQEKLQARVVELLENGMKFNSNYYAIGEVITLDVLTIKNLDDTSYGLLLEKVKAEQQRIVDAENERLRLEQEEKDRIQKQKEDQEAERKKLEKEREDLEKEKKELREQRTKGRAAILENIGMVYDFSSCVWKFTGDGKLLTIPAGTVEALGNDKWVVEYEDMFDKVEALKRAVKAANEAKEKQDKLDKELEDRIKSRAYELLTRFDMKPNGDGYQHKGLVSNLFIEFDDVKNITDIDWPTTLAELQAEADRIEVEEFEIKKQEDEKAESERIAAMSDIERVREHLNKYFTQDAMRTPKIKNEFVKAAYKQFDKEVSSAYNNLMGFLESFQIEK